MSHVHSEYLEEEVEDQKNVQMEMVVESTNDDIPVLSEPMDEDVEKTSKSRNNEKTVIKATKNGKVLVSGYFWTINEYERLKLIFKISFK